MCKLFGRIKEKLTENPYEEAYQKQMRLLEKTPDTPNLAKLAYYCGCEVEDLIEEIGKANSGRLTVTDCIIEHDKDGDGE